MKYMTIGTMFFLMVAISLIIVGLSETPKDCTVPTYVYKDPCLNIGEPQ